MTYKKKKKDGKYAYINENGEVFGGWYDYISDITNIDGVNYIIVRNENKSAFVDKDGHPFGGWAHQIWGKTKLNGVTHVEVRDNRGRKGYVDKNGKFAFGGMYNIISKPERLKLL